MTLVADAAKDGRRVVASTITSLQNEAPKGLSYFWKSYTPKFVPPRIVPDPHALAQTIEGRLALSHELQHVDDILNHPELYYFARISKAPGAGIAHFIYEARGYIQSSGLLNPNYAMASIQSAGRAPLVYRDIGIVAGLVGVAIWSFWYSGGGDE